MKNKRMNQILATILGLAGLVVTLYMFKVHGDVGIYADETGTSGWTSTAPLEWTLTFAGLISMLISFVLLVKYSVGRK